MPFETSTTPKSYVDTKDVSLSTSTSTGLSNTNKAVASLSTLVGGGGSTSAVNSAVASLSTSTSSVLSATNSIVGSLSTSTSTGFSTTNSSVSSLSASTSTVLSNTNSAIASLSTATSTALSTVLNGSSGKDLIKRYTWTTTANQTWNSGTSFIIGETVLAGTPTLSATVRDLPFLGVAAGGTPAAPNGTFSELGLPNGYFKMNNTVAKNLIVDIRFQITPGSVQDVAIQLIKWNGTAWINVPGATRKAWRSNDAISENSVNFITFSIGGSDDFNTGVFAFRFVNQSGTNLALPAQEVILSFFASTSSGTNSSLTPWTAKQTTVIGSTVTAPTKPATPQTDYMRSRKLYDKYHQVQIAYGHSSAQTGAVGSGAYLFTLPDGLQFNTTEHPLYTDNPGTIDVTTLYRFGTVVEHQLDLAGQPNFYAVNALIIPYSDSQFRVCSLTGDGALQWVGGTFTFTLPAVQYRFVFDIATAN